MRRTSLAPLLAVALAACGGSHPTSPSSTASAFGIRHSPFAIDKEKGRRIATAFLQ
jgi:hypothetical protein